jgi:hypothetical protein
MRPGKFVAWACLLGTACRAATAQIPHSPDATASDSVRRADEVKFAAMSARPGRPLFDRVVVEGLPARLRRSVKFQFQSVKTPLQLAQKSALSMDILRRKGYPGVTCVRLEPDTAGGRPTLNVAYDLGRFFYFDTLALHECSSAFYDAAGWRRLGEKKRPYSGAVAQKKLNEVLRAAENRGFAFAAVENAAANFRRHGDSVAVTLEYRFVPGPITVMGDSAEISGDIRETYRFVAGLARLQAGEPYRRDFLERLPLILDNTPYYQNTRVETLFYEKDGKYYFKPVLRLEKKRSNRFDVLAGLLPPRAGESTFSFTALADLILVSALRWGEIFTLHYEKLTRTSQLLDVSYLHPHLFRLPLKAEFRFFLLKQDTLFLTRKIEPAIHYDLTPTLSLKGYFRFMESGLLGAGPYRTVKFPPPPAMNMQSRLFGLRFTHDNTDFRLNPSRGFRIGLDYAAGPRLLKKTPGLDSLEYERLEMRQVRQEATAEARFFFPVFARQVLVLGAVAHRIFLNQYFDNDLAQIGGPKTLRGFNENRFFSHFYVLGTTEYRLRLGREGYTGVFFEGGYVGYRSAARPEEETWPWSVGFMFNVKTPAGMVGLTYAVGATRQIPFQPLRGRIHIGWAAGF